MTTTREMQRRARARRKNEDRQRRIDALDPKVKAMIARLGKRPEDFIK